MKRYSEIESFVNEILTRLEFDDVLVAPGPEMPEVPGAMVVLTRYGGPGEDLEGVLDDVSWQVRAVGDQNNYQSAEDLADAIDINFLSHTTGDVGGRRVVSISRVGGAPTVLLVDDAERTHFVCSYVASVKLALPY